MVRRAVLTVLLAGCGRLGFDARSDMPDASIDAPVDALVTWSAPVLLMTLSSTDGEDDPSLTADLLEVFFDSMRPGGAGGGDIWTASRATAADPFGTPTLVSELALASDDTTPEVAPDGLSIYWSSDRAAQGNRELWVATRATRQSPWTGLARIAELGSPADDANPLVLADNKTMYFSSSRNGNEDIVIATRASTTAAWQFQDTVLGVSDPAEQENQHWVSSDELTAYFTSRPNAADEDIMLATRASKAEPFGPRTRTWSAVNTPAEEADPWLSPDHRTMVFTSDRAGARDLYMITR